MLIDRSCEKLEHDDLRQGCSVIGPCRTV